MPRVLIAETDERPTVDERLFHCGETGQGCSAELTREWRINLLDAPLEYSPRNALSVCGPLWSCHAQRGLAFLRCPRHGCANPRRHLSSPARNSAHARPLFSSGLTRSATRVAVRDQPLIYMPAAAPVLEAPVRQSSHATCASPFRPMQDGAS